MGEIKRFNLPDVGEGLTEAEILAWSVKVGDMVKVNQVLVEIETAKAAVELPSPYAGKVVELLVDEGQTVDVGTPIIGIDTDPSTPGTGGAAGGDDMTAGVAATAEAKAAPAAGKARTAKREPVLVGYGVKQSASGRRPRKTAARRRRRPTSWAPRSARSRSPTTSRLRRTTASPRRRRRPRRRSADRRRRTAPSDRAGRREAAGQAAGPQARQGPRRRPGAAWSRPAPTAPSPGRTSTRPPPARRPRRAHRAGHRPARQRRGRRAVRQRRAPRPGQGRAQGHRRGDGAVAFTAPHVTEFLTVDVTADHEARAAAEGAAGLRGRAGVAAAAVAKALLVAMARNPEINARWDEAAGRSCLDHVNLGIAAATPRGLIVPNIKDADALTLARTGRALGELTATAREGKTSPADMAGGTVTITNVGVFGVDTGTPILNPGEAAILAFGAVREQPWVHKGKVKPRQVTTLALSFDHRLVDGELGSKVLRDVGAVLADPLTALAWS